MVQCTLSRSPAMPLATATAARRPAAAAAAAPRSVLGSSLWRSLQGAALAARPAAAQRTPARRQLAVAPQASWGRGGGSPDVADRVVAGGEPKQRLLQANACQRRASAGQQASA